MWKIFVEVHWTISHAQKQSFEDFFLLPWQPECIMELISLNYRIIQAKFNKSGRVIKKLFKYLLRPEKKLDDNKSLLKTKKWQNFYLQMLLHVWEMGEKSCFTVVDT